MYGIIFNYVVVVVVVRCSVENFAVRNQTIVSIELKRYVKHFVVQY